MAAKLEHWPLKRLVPYARNARTHSPAQVAQIAASIQEFGFTNPILVATDAGILAGHGRLAAARELGLQTVPVVVLDHLTPEQRRAYVLADNQLALNAGWDQHLLRSELLDLRTDGVEWDLLGFGADDIGELFSIPDTDADPEPEPEDEPEPERGQPLAIVLQPEELRRWREAKQQLGLSLDRSALLRLVDHYLEETDG